MPFASQVKPLWDKSELTLAQLADLCKISESSASRYLSGKVNPPADIAEKILEALGAPPPAEGDKDMQTIVQHIREIYEAQIGTMREHHAAQIATMREHHTSQIAAMQADHASRVEDLRRDKVWMFRAIIVLFVVVLYICADAMHGNWGLFQYPVL